MSRTNCKNCGAPLRGNCDYCGTRYLLEPQLFYNADIIDRDALSETATGMAIKANQRSGAFWSGMLSSAFVALPGVGLRIDG